MANVAATPTATKRGLNEIPGSGSTVRATSRGVNTESNTLTVIDPVTYKLTLEVETDVTQIGQWGQDQRKTIDRGALAGSSAIAISASGDATKLAAK